MRYPKWFARWRLQVWDNRLADWRKEWNRATAIGPGVTELDVVSTEVFYERLVTKGMVKRVLWRKRLGIKLAQGGPVKRGTPYTLGDRGCDFVVPPRPKPRPDLRDPGQ